jgi:hypothetical protein
MVFKAKLPLTTQIEIQSAHLAKTESIQTQSLTQWILLTNTVPRPLLLHHVVPILKLILNAKRAN